MYEILINKFCKNDYDTRSRPTIRLTSGIALSECVCVCMYNECLT